MATGTLTQQQRKAMAWNLYGHGVRMGNWKEDIYLEEVKTDMAECLRDPPPPNPAGPP